MLVSWVKREAAQLEQVLLGVGESNYSQTKSVFGQLDPILWATWGPVEALSSTTTHKNSINNKNSWKTYAKIHRHSSAMTGVAFAEQRPSILEASELPTSLMDFLSSVYVLLLFFFFFYHIFTPMWKNRKPHWFLSVGWWWSSFLLRLQGETFLVACRLKVVSALSRKSGGTLYALHICSHPTTTSCSKQVLIQGSARQC